MALNDQDQARVRDYLLGHLSDEEQDKIEERLMTEDDLFDELEISKGELIEEYCGGELSRNEHEWFEQHYLASADGKQTHAVAVALNTVKCPIPAPRKLTWFERLQNFLKVHRWAVAAATSAAVLIIVVGPFIYRPTPPTSYAFSLS